MQLENDLLNRLDPRLKLRRLQQSVSQFRPIHFELHNGTYVLASGLNRSFEADLFCAFSIRTENSNACLNGYIGRQWFWECTKILLPERLIRSEIASHFAAVNLLLEDLLSPLFNALGLSVTRLEEPKTSQLSETVEVALFEGIDCDQGQPVMTLTLPTGNLKQVLVSARSKSPLWGKRRDYWASTIRLDFQVDLISWPIERSQMHSIANGGVLRLLQRLEFATPVLHAVMYEESGLNVALKIRMRDHEMETLNDTDSQDIPTGLLNHPNRISFRLGSSSLTLADLASLSRGDQIPIILDDWPFVEIMQGKEVLGRGELVLMNEEVAVQITELRILPELLENHAIL